jgi:iron complex outermembrane receptor protein
MSKHALMMACAVSALGFGAGAAKAATATASAASPTTVADIVVTAEKREATIQTIATAVSAYTSQERDLIGIDTITDLQNFTPGLRYSASLDRIFLRGVGRQTNNLATDPGVATYVDGVYDSATYDAGGDELFIARTEVLRGPQGTLYGRNSIGGDINVISVMPTHEYYAEIRATAANYGHYQIEGVGSGPINDHLRFRVGGSYLKQTQGYFQNVAIGGQTEDGNQTNEYFEAQLEGDLGSKFDFWGKVAVSSYHGTYRTTNVVSDYDTLEFAPGTLGPNMGFAYNPAFAAEGGTFTQAGVTKSNPAVSNQWLYNTATPNLIKIDPNYSFTWHATYHADGFDVKYVGGYAHHNLVINSGFGNTPVTSITYPLNTTAPASASVLNKFFVPNSCVLNNFSGTPCGPLTLTGPTTNVYTENKSWYSHEVDFVSNNDSPLQWLGGLYYYRETYDQSSVFALPNVPQMATPLAPFTGPGATISAGTPAAPNPSRAILSTDEKMHADSYAAFGQIDWKFMPDWKLTAGIRYTYDDKAGVESIRELCLSCQQFFGSFFGAVGGLSPENTGSLTPVWDVTQVTGFIDTAAEKGAGPVTFNSTTGFASRPLSDHWSGVTGTLGIEWSPSRDLLAYAKYSRGYKSGGFNAGSIVATPDVGPEALDAFEGGVKKTFGGRLTLDAAAFYYNYTDMQIELGQNFNGTTKFFLQGLPQVHSYGFELESMWQATDNLQFILSYAYLNTNITKSGCYLNGVLSTSPSDASCVVSTNATTLAATANGLHRVNGNQLIDAPPNKIAINANYTFHFDTGKLTFSASDTWTDYHYSSIFNGPLYRTPGYNNLDLRVLWTDAKDRFTIIGFAKNALNETQYDYIYPGTSAGQPNDPVQVTHSLNPPLTYGFQFQVRFR